MVWLVTATGVLETVAAVGFAYAFSGFLGGKAWAWLAIALLALRWLFRLTSLVLGEWSTDQHARRLRAQFLSQRLQAAAPWEASSDGVIVEAAAKRIAREQGLVKPVVLGLVPASVVVLAAMATVSWYLALLLSLTLPLVVVFLVLIGSQTEAKGRHQLEALDRLGLLLLDRLKALPELWLAGDLDRQRRLLNEASQQHKSQTFSLLKVAFLSGAAVDLLASLAIALIAVQVGVALLNLIEMGDLADVGLSQGLFLLMLAPELFLPWRRLVGVWHDRNQAKSAQEKLKVWQDLPHAKHQPPAGLSSLQTGQRVWLSGPSGSGKSRWLNHLAGLTSETAVADRLGWVEQHPWFEPQTLSELAFSVDARPSDVLEQLRLLGLSERVPRPDTWLSPEQLSGGERARLVTGLALARKPDVLLLDEPTASLDEDSRTRFWAALTSVSIPIVVASHDDLSDWATAVVRL